MRMFIGEGGDCVALRASIWQHALSKAVGFEVTSPDAVSRGHVVRSQTFNAQSEIGLFLVRSHCFCNCSHCAIADALSARIRIKKHEHFAASLYLKLKAFPLSKGVTNVRVMGKMGVKKGEVLLPLSF